MPRITHQAWWCYIGHKNGPHSRECSECGRPRYERHASVHASEKAVVYYNPATGEHRTPARADQPLPQVYARQGFERREIESIIAWEKEAGVVHEPTTFNAGNEDPGANFCDPVVTREAQEKAKAVKDAIINDIRDAVASGPWTGAENLVDSPAL